VNDTGTAAAIRRAARALGRAAADMRRAAEPGGELAALIDILRSGRPLDQNDHDMLALLLAGELNAGRGKRGKGHRALPAAEREARALGREHGLSLPAAAERVAATYGMQPSTLVNELHRNKCAFVADDTGETHRSTPLHVNTLRRATVSKTKPADRAAEVIHPDFIYRTAEYGRKLFGFSGTQLREKIRTGEVPKPVRLSSTGRAQGWLGSQILEHHAALKARSAEN